MKNLAVVRSISILIFIGIGCLLLAISMIRPYPAPELIEIGPNQTAFLIPLEGSSGDGQAKYQSVDMLKKNQVAVKRVEIPKVWKKTGYFPRSGRYVSSAKVILVDRNLVTREWKGVDQGGASSSNQAISVESLESITFRLQVMLNAVIQEKDAANFLYWYGGKSLEEVMDTNIRADVADSLAKEFGRHTLNECRKLKADIFNDVRTSVTLLYAERGVTLTTLGVNGGLVYEDPAIQKSMNEQFLSLNAQIIATNKMEEQHHLNQIKLESAQTERKAAEEIAMARDAYRTIREMEVRKLLAEKWNGQLPRFMLGGVGQGDSQQASLPMLLNMPSELLTDAEETTPSM